MRALRISSFGNPTDVLELIDIPEPSQPDPGLALIGVEFAPINHNDLLLIKEHSTGRLRFHIWSAMRALAVSWPLVREFRP